MGELRRFIKSNNIIMRLVSLVLTVAILASALVYFGNEKMEKVSAEEGTTKPYMQYIVQRLIDGAQDEFNILEIVPYKGQGEFGYYASDDDIAIALEGDQAYLETLYSKVASKNANGTWSKEDEWVKIDGEFSSFNYMMRYNSSTKKFEVKGPDTFTNYIVPEYGDLIAERLNVNTVEANKITDADINNADLIIISTGTHDANTIAAYRKYSGDSEKLVFNKKDNGEFGEVADDGLISYNSFEKVLRSELPENPDEPEIPDTPVITSGKVYFKNDDNWGEVYIYYWNKTNDKMTQWPGEKMSLVEGEDNIYVYEINSDVENIIFSNSKSSQTSTLAFPGFEKVYAGGEWVDYPIVEVDPSEPTTPEETDPTTPEETDPTTPEETDPTTPTEPTTPVEPTTPTEPTTPVEPDSEFAYITRDMSWSMCEKLLDYMIIGKDMELPDGTVLTNVKTPVIIDNGGIGNLNTDSNMYKMLLIYRMCGTDKWQQLKELIVKTDASGKKIKSEAGAATVAVNVGGTLLTKWVSGNDNTIKAVLGNGTDYRETEPFMSDNLTNDYWVYNGNASLIPNQYSKNNDGTVKNYPRITKTKASQERIGSSDSVIDALRYLLGAKASQTIKFSDQVRVLEIQPCNCFQYNTSAKKQELANKLLRTDASKITVDCVTPNALNGMTVDIASEYDLVIIGDYIGSGSEANGLKQSNGKTIYNDRNLNGYIYLAFGDLIKISTYALGYLPDEYLEVTSSQATYSVSDANSYVWTKYLFEQLKKNKYYVVHDMRNYYVTQSKVKKLSSGKIDNASFYNDHALGNTRLSDNDITDITRKKLEDYVKTGNPIVVAESVYTADRTKLYPTSDMYQFASETLGATDSTGRRINTNVLKDETMGSAVAYLGTKAPRIKFVEEDNVPYIERTGRKITVVEDGVSKQVDEYVEKTAKLSVKPVDPHYSNYTYKKSNGSSETVTDVIDRFNNRKLRYKFNITGQAGKTYLVKLLVDKNNDGVFNDVNSGVADDNNEVYYSQKVKLNSRTTTYEINSALADNFVGMLAWKIDVIELDSAGKETVYRVSEKGYSAIRNEDIRKLKVLQIAPEKQGGGNYLELSTGDFDKLMNAVEGIVGYDMSVTLKSVSEFNSQFGGEQGRTKLFEYDMIVLGFKDSYGSKDITNGNGALDNILAYMDAGKSVLFTHDTVSWRSTPNYKAGYKSGNGYKILSPGSIYDIKVDGNTGSQTQYGDTCFNLTINFRNRVGMDRYGVTLKYDYDKGTEQNPREGKEVPKYGIGCAIPSYMATQENSKKVQEKDAKGNVIRTYDVATKEIEVRELQGFNNWNTARMNFCFNVASSYIDNKNSNNYYWLAPYKDDSYDNSDSSSVMYKTKKVVQLNEGPITKYPYEVGTNPSIAETHGQYFELDMEDEDIVVWYTLDAGSSYYTRTYKDASNNFYIYSKNNITYSGAGHESIKDSQELKLFVNTIVKAIAGGNSEPVITVTNGAEVTSGTETYNLVYVNSADTAANYEIDFKAEDADLVSLETVGDNIALVGEFSSAKIYWLKPSATGAGTEEKLIKEYGAVNSAGKVVTDPLKNGIIQELLLGNGHTNLTKDELDAIEKAVEVTKTGANFKIEVMDSKGMKDTVYVQLQVRDLFDMD